MRAALLDQLDSNRFNPFKAWRQKNEERLSPEKVIQAYKDGYAGAIYDPEAQEEFLDLSQSKFGSVVASDNGWSDDDVTDQLICPFTHVVARYPGCWPGPPQRRGDCVSHNQKNADLGTSVLESILGIPDPISGFLETVPDLSPEAIRNGAFATEPYYWFRGHNGDGWSCAESMSTALKHSACVPRGIIEGTDIDVTQYDSKLAGRWGATPPPANIRDALDNHLFRDGVQLEQDPKMIGKFLMRGVFVGSCGGEGFADKRPEVKDNDGNICCGPTPRQGGWSHAIAIIAADFRNFILKMFGEPLFLFLNSWGSTWISGPRRIIGSPIEVPHGSFWARWSDVRRRSFFAASGFNGWKRSRLVDHTPILV